MNASQILNDNHWPRLDKATGFTLCESCWNFGSRQHLCAGPPCQCYRWHGFRRHGKKGRSTVVIPMAV
jgi:hypothetical protein